MAYHIMYGKSRTAYRTAKLRKTILTLAFLGLFICCAIYLVGEHLYGLRQALFPQEQVELLLERLRAGEAITDAVAAFCEGVMYGN